MTAVLSTDAVERRYRRGSETIHAVDGVSVTLVPGEVTLLQGPSGSGKSTLVHLLAGWERPDAGSVLWNGDDVRPEMLRWDQLALVPQRLGLLPELSALENAVLPHRTSGRGDLAAAFEAERDRPALLPALDDVARMEVHAKAPRAGDKP